MTTAARPDPDFFLAGASKSGTTALYSYLKDHPSIFMPELKEPHYFSRDLPGLRVVEDEESYRDLFTPAPEECLTGEASASYLMSRVAVNRILQRRPDARFIVMLRNPIEMAHALHSELLYNLNEDVEGFEEAWNLQEERAAGREIPAQCREPKLLQYRDTCAIGDQLERFAERTAEECRLIILFDDFKADPSEAYERAVRHLSLSPDDRARFPKVNPNKTVRSRWLAGIHRRLPELLGPLYEPLKTLGNRVGIRPSRLMERFNLKETSRSSLETDFHRHLTMEFRDQVQKVSRILDRDLSHWLDTDRETPSSPGAT